MGQILFSVSLCLASSLVCAQGAPPDGRGSVPPPDRDAQRREQIREVLKPGRAPVIVAPSPGGNSVLVASPPAYQLTPQGRAELREQLRRERYENRGVRP